MVINRNVDAKMLDAVTQTLLFSQDSTLASPDGYISQYN